MTTDRWAAAQTAQAVYEASPHETPWFELEREVRGRMVDTIQAWPPVDENPAPTPDSMRILRKADVFALVRAARSMMEHTRAGTGEGSPAHAGLVGALEPFREIE